MRLKVVLCQTKYLALVAIHQLAGSLGERNPERAFYFDSHFGGDVVDLSRSVAQQIEAHDFEHALAVTPVADVDVLDVREFGDELGNDAGFLLHLANRRRLRSFARIEQPFRKCEHGRSTFAGQFRGCRAFLRRFDQGNVPRRRDFPKHNAARRDLSHHVVSKYQDFPSCAVTCRINCHARSTCRDFVFVCPTQSRSVNFPSSRVCVRYRFPLWLRPSISFWLSSSPERKRKQTRLSGTGAASSKRESARTQSANCCARRTCSRTCCCNPSIP